MHGNTTAHMSLTAGMRCLQRAERVLVRGAADGRARGQVMHPVGVACVRATPVTCREDDGHHLPWRWARDPQVRLMAGSQEKRQDLLAASA